MAPNSRGADDLLFERPTTPHKFNVAPRRLETTGKKERRYEMSPGSTRGDYIRLGSADSGLSMTLWRPSNGEKNSHGNETRDQV